MVGGKGINVQTHNRYEELKPSLKFGKKIPWTTEKAFVLISPGFLSVQVLRDPH